MWRSWRDVSGDVDGEGNLPCDLERRWPEPTSRPLVPAHPAASGTAQLDVRLTTLIFPLDDGQEVRPCVATIEDVDILRDVTYQFPLVTSQQVVRLPAPLPVVSAELRGEWTGGSG